MLRAIVGNFEPVELGEYNSLRYITMLARSFWDKLMSIAWLEVVFQMSALFRTEKSRSKKVAISPVSLLSPLTLMLGTQRLM